MYSCSRLVQFERRKQSVLASNGEIYSSICVSACGASGPDLVLIVGDCGGVPGSSVSVSTAARRGDGSHSDDADCERMISIHKPSMSTFICRLNSSGV